MNIEKPALQNDFESQLMNRRELSEVSEAVQHKDSGGGIIRPDIRYIENTSASALFGQNHPSEWSAQTNSESKSEVAEKQSLLTEEEKAKVREKHPDWPDEIIDAIGSWKEYEIYDKANLQVAYINDKPCLIRTDIDMDQKDPQGRTNKERMEQGLAPLDKNGNPIQLHHIGQKADSPLAELTKEEHMGNTKILHDTTKKTEVHGEGNHWDDERRKHWEDRATQS